MKKIILATLVNLSFSVCGLSQSQKWTFGTEESFDGKYKWAMIHGEVTDGPKNSVVAIIINDVPSTVNGESSSDPENNLILNVPSSFVDNRIDCELEEKIKEIKETYSSIGLESFGYVKIRFSGLDKIFSWAVSGNIEDERSIIYISQYQTLKELNQSKPNFVDYLKRYQKMFVRFIPNSNCALFKQIDMEFSLSGSTETIKHFMNY